MKSKSFPVTLALVLFLIAIVNGLAQYHHWYWTMRRFDMPMHFTGGAWLAGVALWARFFSGKFMGEMRSFKHVLLWGLGVALCFKNVAFGQQALAQLLEIINFTVENYPEATVLVGNGLVAG